MTAKIDGTNGVLQAYDYQTPATGFSYTFSAGTQTLLMVPAGTLATGTITMPASPADGMVITFSSSQQITALTLQGNTGQSISSAVTFLPAKTAVSYVYRLANTTWYPCASVPGTGSQLVQATAQNTTSGTSIDFTGIPSWAKRITVGFSGVGTTGTSAVIIQLGSGSVTTTGYLGAGNNAANGAGWTILNFTTGLTTSYDSNAGRIRYGFMQIVNVTGNTWVSSTVLANSAATTMSVGAGGITLGGAIDRLRITTVNGTDTFNAGSINIMYE